MLTKTTSAITLYKNTHLPEGFVYVEDICPEIIQDMKYATTDNFTGKIVDGYVTGKAILTKEAANALCEVQKELEQQGLALLIWDAYRPTQAVKQFFNWRLEKDNPQIKERYHPTLSKKDLFEQGFISPNNSTHSRGSTVDLTIVSQQNNKPLDMGTGFDFFGEKAHTNNNQVSTEAQQNRNILKNLMAKYGFENLPQEWWHYTLKNEPFADQYFDFPVQ